MICLEATQKSTAQAQQSNINSFKYDAQFLQVTLGQKITSDKKILFSSWENSLLLFQLYTTST